MPEQVMRPPSAVPIHERKKLKAVAKFHKRGERAIPEKVAIIFRSIAEPTSDVLILGLAEQETVQTPPERMVPNNILSRSLSREEARNWWEPQISILICERLRHHVRVARLPVVDWARELLRPPTASPANWARVYCGCQPGPTRVALHPGRMVEEPERQPYVHWTTCYDFEETWIIDVYSSMISRRLPFLLHKSVATLS